MFFAVILPSKRSSEARAILLAHSKALTMGKNSTFPLTFVCLHIASEKKHLTPEHWASIAVKLSPSYIDGIQKTSNAEYFSINNIPQLAYDHNEIISYSLNVLKDKITKTNILKNLFPDVFTLPELQKVYEIVLEEKFDRRNFRKKLINEKVIIDTNKYETFEGKKPAKLYKFNKNVKKENAI